VALSSPSMSLSAAAPSGIAAKPVPSVMTVVVSNAPHHLAESVRKGSAGVVASPEASAKVVVSVSANATPNATGSPAPGPTPAANEPKRVAPASQPTRNVEDRLAF
jgi:hypothetical protein